MGLPFLSFIFLTGLSSFRELPLPFANGFLPVRLSALTDCVSLHAALLFLLSIRLVRSCFGASNAFLCSSFAYVEFVSSFGSFRFQLFFLRCCNLLHLRMCVFAFIFLLSHLSVFELVSLSFSFAFIGLISGVSSSSFFVIIVSCITLLSDSLSCLFFPVLRTFIVFLLVLGWWCLFLPLQCLPVGLSRCCPLFSCTFRSLSPRLFGVPRLGLFLLSFLGHCRDWLLHPQ